MRRITITTRVLLIIAIMCMLSGCEYQDRKYVSTSPNGENTITIKYDFASRPILFYDDKKIWEYPNSGFNEEAFFYIEWESEDTFTLKYDDESHNGMYAEEYQFDLNQ